MGKQHDRPMKSFFVSRSPHKSLLSGFHLVMFQLCGVGIFLCVWKINHIIISNVHGNYWQLHIQSIKLMAKQ